MHPCGETSGPTCKVLLALPVKDLHRPGASNQSCCLKQVQGKLSLWGSSSSIRMLSFFLAQTHHILCGWAVNILRCLEVRCRLRNLFASQGRNWRKESRAEREKGEKASQVRGSNRRKWTSEGKKHPRGLPGAKAVLFWKD